MPFNKLYPVSNRQEEDWKINNLYGPEILFEKLILSRFNKQALYNSCALLLKKHESLRTTFEFESENLYQKVNPFNNPDLYVQDLPTNSLKEKEFIRKQQSLMNDLSKAPLFKVFVRPLKNNSARIYFIIHHIIADDWSVNIILKEFRELYQKFDEGLEPEFEALPCQLKEYCSLINKKHLARKDSEKNYWIKKFDENLLQSLQSRLISRLTARKKLKLPDDQDGDIINALGEQQTPRECEMQMPDSISKRVYDLADKHKVSISNILITGLALVMYRQYQITEVLMSSVISDRFYKESKKLIANLSGGVFFRFKIENEMSLKELIEKIYLESLQSFKHTIFNYEPYMHLPLRSASLMHFNYMDQSMHQQLSGKQKKTGINNLHKKADCSFYPLSVIVLNNQTGLKFTFQYNINFYASNEIDVLFNQLNQVIDLVYLNPDATINDLSTAVLA